jgi:DNA primase
MTNKEKICFILEKYDITFWTEGKNVSKDSVNVCCPFCQDKSNHMGIFEDSLLCHCWRCGTKGDFFFLLHQLTGLSLVEYKELIEESGVEFKQNAEEQIKNIVEQKNEKPQTRKKVNIPENLPPLLTTITKETSTPLFEAFLKRRRITVDDCINHHCLIGVIGEYSNRMIIPVFFQGKIVTFQAADMTGRAQLKYKTAKGDINNYIQL